jgi:hypothetical protein
MKFKALLSLLVCASLLVLGAAGCKRREQAYAGIPEAQATGTVDPNARY